jgi:ABC-type sugar transport system substrate-binding protein
MIAPVTRAIDAGIPVIVFDGKAPDELADKIAGAVQTDNSAAGKLAAEGMIQGLRDQGLTSGNVIFISGTKAMGLTQDREKAFLDEMAANGSEFTVVANEDGNWDPTLTSTIASNLFAKFGADGVQGAYGMADYMAIPIAEAAKQLGIAVGGASGLIVTASNCSVAGLDAIRAGDIFQSVDQDPQTIATETADYVLGFLQGQDLPKVLMVEMSAINASNVEDFVNQCNY